MLLMQSNCLYTPTYMCFQLMHYELKASDGLVGGAAVNTGGEYKDCDARAIVVSSKHQYMGTCTQLHKYANTQIQTGGYKTAISWQLSPAENTERGTQVIVAREGERVREQ